jgi:hypothetical protein
VGARAGKAYAGTMRAPGVVLTMMAASRKLSPIKLEDCGPGRKPRPVPQGPYCAATYVSIRSTCPDACAFKDSSTQLQQTQNGWPLMRARLFNARLVAALCRRTARAAEEIYASTWAETCSTKRTWRRLTMRLWTML